MNVLQNSSFNKGFDNVFIEFESKELSNLKNNNCLRLFYLNIQNNIFDYEGLFNILQKNIGRYVYSRATIDKFIENDEMDAISLKAVDLLRTAAKEKDNGAGGELGEILLYLFLEQKLNAPKLLSKVELKTTSNQYIFGSDAIHLLSLDSKSFQLIFGESKIKNDLKDAVNEAFISINNVINNKSNELRLVEKCIMSESYDKDTMEFIESIIVPTKRNCEIESDNAFGIFLGYSFSLDDDKLSNSEYRKRALQKMKDDIEIIKNYIEKKINKLNLCNYSFYFYILPFNNASKDRMNIIKRLKGEK